MSNENTDEKKAAFGIGSTATLADGDLHGRNSLIIIDRQHRVAALMGEDPNSPECAAAIEAFFGVAANDE